MAKIFYSLAGEGRGHATRVRAVVQMLMEQHDIVLFTFSDSYRFLAPLFRGTDVSVRRIPGMLFSYTPDHHIDFMRTGLDAIRYIAGLPWLLNDLGKLIEIEKPDLVITDFEPAVPRAAERYRIPVVSLDHQHVLATSDLSALPTYLQEHTRNLRRCVEAFYAHQVETIVSSFYAPPLRPGLTRVTQVGVLLREEFFALTPQPGAYLLVYWRKFATPQMMEMLHACGREVRVYGLGAQPDDGNLRFFDVDPHRFVADLAGCDALVTTAGNQLLGEALYLRKPVFAIPETKNYEQYINAHYLQQSGMGTWAEAAQVRPADLHRFLEQLETYRAAIDPAQVCGNRRTLEALGKHLPTRAPARARAPEHTLGLACE